MATFKAIVFSTKNHIKNDGTTNIKIRVYHNEESQYIPTEFYLPPLYMGKNGEVQEDYPEADLINYELGELIQGYRKLVIQLGTHRLKNVNCKDLKEYLTQASEPDYELIDFVAFSRRIIAKTKKKNTLNWYTVAINSLVWFYGKQVIDAKEITSSKLQAYIEQLTESGGQNKKPFEPGAVNNYLRALRSLFNKCKLKYNDDNLDIIRIQHDPFVKIKIPAVRRKRKNIGIDEIKRIRDGVFNTERENIGRDIFMMMFYLMGININDLFLLKPPKRGRIEYERSKTNTDDNIHNFLLSINNHAQRTWL